MHIILIMILILNEYTNKMKKNISPNPVYACMCVFRCKDDYQIESCNLLFNNFVFHSDKKAKNIMLKKKKTA